MDSAGHLTDGAWLEENFWAAETFGADSDDVAVRKLVGFLLVETFRCGLQISIMIERNVAQHLLNIAHNLAFRGGGEGVPRPVRIFIIFSVRSRFSSAVAATVAATQRCPALLSRPGLAATVAIVEGRGQPRRRPLRSAPGYSGKKPVDTHLSNTFGSGEVSEPLEPCTGTCPLHLRNEARERGHRP